MKLISMVLYGTNPRYWQCLIPSLITHWELYPGFTIRLYHTPEVKTCAGWPILEQLEKMTKRLELVQLEQPYTKHEPMMRRLTPLWDENVSVFFMRDLDSVPSRLELLSAQAFLESGPHEYWIHSIRSHRYHTIILMGGLSGFRPAELHSFRYKYPTYDDYFKAFPVEYDSFCDQRAMEKAFQAYRHWIFDTPIEGAPRLEHSQKPDWLGNENLLSYLEQNFFKPTDENPQPFTAMSRYDMRKEGKKLLEEIDCDSTRMVKEAFIEARFPEDQSTL